jgi:hypothetical protein
MYEKVVKHLASMEHDEHGLGNQTVLPLSLNQAKLKDLDIEHYNPQRM